MIEKTCELCGKTFYVLRCREKTARYCSKECSAIGRKSKDFNCTCSICGKKFHVKPSRKKNRGKKLGIYCSKECLNKAKEILYKGEGNHQYGLKGNLNSSFKGDVIRKKNNKLTDIMVFCPTHPFCNENGRVKEHRLIVEENYFLFDSKYFTEIDGKMYLLKSIEVHHIDGNHFNNDITNLMPCTKSEHRKFHKFVITERDSLGRIVKTKMINQTELILNKQLNIFDSPELTKTS